MIYQDALYGQVEFPDFIEELMQTPLVQRLKHISQDVLPQNCLSWPVPTRFEHCLGTCALAVKEVLTAHLWWDDDYPPLKGKKLLPISALLHDAGNPPFSHTSELILKQVLNKDGESFLEEMLEGSDAERIIQKLGLSTGEVVDFVTGRTAFSKVLNGSIDMDNLDNIGRYWFTYAGETLFDAQKIAHSFYFNGAEWTLYPKCMEETKKWQEARRKVYRVIYSYPHLAASQMMFRALYIAWIRGEITKEFFFLNEESALDFLQNCNEQSAMLVGKLLNHHWYQEVVSMETTQPHSSLQKLGDFWNSRSLLADCIREYLHNQTGLLIPSGFICAYVGAGKDQRRITLSFYDGEDVFHDEDFYDKKKYDPTYRLKVYVHPELESKKGLIQDFVRTLVN